VRLPKTLKHMFVEKVARSSLKLKFGDFSLTTC
jgi:hypothetical protein